LVGLLVFIYIWVVAMIETERRKEPVA